MYFAQGEHGRGGWIALARPQGVLQGAVQAFGHARRQASGPGQGREDVHDLIAPEAQYGPIAILAAEAYTTHCDVMLKPRIHKNPLFSTYQWPGGITHKE